VLSFQLKKKLREFSLDISCTIGEETLVLIGRSGCGKTTTLQILAGLVKADVGSISLNQQMLLNTAEKCDIQPEQRHIGVVFQNYALFPHLTVAENIAYGLHHASPREVGDTVTDMIHRFGLAALANSMPDDLSGGQQQRVAIARALVTKPQLLLLDEPLSALDVSTRGHVRSELKQILSGLSIPSIVVTHDYEDARVLGDSIAVMDRGQIIQMGSPTELAEKPVSPFVAQFTSTNLVTMSERLLDGNIVERDMVAFEPWQLSLSLPQISSAEVGPLSWRGRIVDRVLNGSFHRFWIAGEVTITAEIPGVAGQSPFSIGDEVVANVSQANVRRYTVTLPTSMIEAEGLIETESQSVVDSSGVGLTATATMQSWRPKSRWRKFATPLVGVAGLVIAVGLIPGFISMSQAQNSASSHSGNSGLTAVQLTAFVAANATDPFNQAIRVFETQHAAITMQANYAGTQVLQTQLEQGAPDDIFLSADLSHIQQIQKEGLIKTFFPVSHDEEVIVVPKSNPAGITSLRDLGEKKVKLIIGVTSVPIGQYTRKIFTKADSVYGAAFSTNALGHVVSLETNVKQILEKVALDDADAGIVYKTDVTADMLAKVTVIQIPPQLNFIATNFIAIPRGAPHAQLAEDFMKLILGPTGQQIFLHDGYLPLDGGR